MSFYVSDIEQDTLQNENFRKVLNTNEHSQSEHPDDTVHKNKAEADEYEEKHH